MLELCKIKVRRIKKKKVGCITRQTPSFACLLREDSLPVSWLFSLLIRSDVTVLYIMLNLNLFLGLRQMQTTVYTGGLLLWHLTEPVVWSVIVMECCAMSIEIPDNYGTQDSNLLQWFIFYCCSYAIILGWIRVLVRAKVARSLR